MEIIQGMKQLEYLTVSGTLEDLTGFEGMHRLVMLEPEFEPAGPVWREWKG